LESTGATKSLALVYLEKQRMCQFHILFIRLSIILDNKILNKDFRYGYHLQMTFIDNKVEVWLLMILVRFLVICAPKWRNMRWITLINDRVKKHLLKYPTWRRQIESIVSSFFEQSCSHHREKHADL